MKENKSFTAPNSLPDFSGRKIYTSLKSRRLSRKLEREAKNQHRQEQAIMEDVITFGYTLTGWYEGGKAVMVYENGTREEISFMDEQYDPMPYFKKMSKMFVGTEYIVSSMGEDIDFLMETANKYQIDMEELLGRFTLVMLDVNEKKREGTAYLEIETGGSF